VLDDGGDMVKDLMPDDPRIHYFRELSRKTYGAKLNQCIKLAAGEYVIHFDDDDFHASNRIERQVWPLIYGPEFLVSGTSTIYYHRHGTQDVYQYVGAREAWIGGLCYRKATAVERPFDVLNEPGADLRWLQQIPAAARFDLADPALIVASAHAANHSPKQMSGRMWRKVPYSLIASLIDETSTRC
jgi:glycosyltransferase involved in cell wall biosynthesis